ncbi:Protein phnB [Thermobacillus xylanilyticus]|uniref:Protein phnB n=1 Tax=Thermobacillus xylanilyticus TaxID=76633 RepID=A0ABM8V6F7_THEXY|nr:VOC family protein [Thermobacillus xylanilyticus]CAG5090508.1 Protein phnB [Thermobacillus xylanilyticus]
MSIRLNPYLIFNGNAGEAIYFYEKALGGQIMGIMSFGDMPSVSDHPVPEEARDLVMHALLKVGDSELMFSDAFPGMPYQQGSAVEIAVVLDDEAQARKIFDALSEGGEVVMPLQKTDWSPLYGMVKDKYGVSFQVNVAGEQ